MLEDVKDRRIAGGHLTGNSADHFTGTGKRNLDFLDVGSKKGKGGKGCGTDGETLSCCCSCVSKGVENIGPLTDLRLELGHLGISACVVGDRAIGIGSEGDAEG